MSFGKPKILVVDDLRANIEVLGGILRPDYEIIMALSGPKALKLAEFEPLPNLILLDSMMLGMDGYEVCRQLKKNPATRGIPIIFVSAKGEEIDEVTGLDLGAVDFITKPISPAIVKARVKTHLNLAAAMKELEKQNDILMNNIRVLEQIEQIARHDLKGPLTIFLNALDYMGQTGNLSPQQLDFLKMLDESAVKMHGIIDRSLDLVKMERGQYKIKPVPVDMVKIVRLVSRELESLAKRKRVEYSIMLNGQVMNDSDSCLVQGETILLSSIVSNLLKNAIEASPEGEKVVIGMSEQNPFLIEIRNQGVIPPEIKSRFLERYATYGKQKGTGLGSYSAGLMAKTLGGDIRFVSAKETGTTITVSIPHQEAIPKK